MGGDSEWHFYGEKKRQEGGERGEGIRETGETGDTEYHSCHGIIGYFVVNRIVISLYYA